MSWRSHWRVMAAAVCAAAGLSGAGFVLGSASSLSASVTAICATPYEVVVAHSDGAVAVEAPTGSCNPAVYGSMAGRHLNAPIVGLAATPDGNGYWLVAADGGVFTFGDAPYYGSMGNQRLNAPIVGMASSPDGHGYWLVASDGGIFSFGDAQFAGSLGGFRLNKPVVGMAVDAATRGYWLAASDGGVFSFGNAPFFGSLGSFRLNSAIRTVTGSPDSGGYWLVGSDGGVFNFGDARYFGSAAGSARNGWNALVSTPDAGGYWLFANAFSGNGVALSAFGDATSALSAVGGDTSGAIVVGAATVFANATSTLSVISNPADQHVAAPGDTATFTAAATGVPAPSVQWQASVDFGKTFISIPNANSTTLSFITTQSESGGEYRAVFSSGANSVTTSAAVLTVGGAPYITAQPVSQEVTTGSTVTFTSAASGTPTPTVQWAVSSDGGATFLAVPGATSPTLTFTSTSAENGDQYKALYTNSVGSTPTSTVTLTVVAPGGAV